MSRRRPARSHRHLERDQAIAEQVADQLDSRGQCPGPCNAGYRRRLEKFEAARGQVLKAWGGPAHPDLLDREAAVLAPVGEPRPGRPVWCASCANQIRLAVDRLPRLLRATVTVSDAPARRKAVQRRPAGMKVDPRKPFLMMRPGPLVTAPVLVLSSEFVGRGETVELLACGHRMTWRGLGPSPVERVCRTCVAAAMEPEPGRLAPPPGRTEKTGPSKRPPFSPAGSPAWVEADAGIQWVCSVADQIRYALGLASGDPGDEPETWDWRAGSEEDRLVAARRASSWLLDRLDAVLALPDPLPASFGRDARSVAGRLEVVSGEKVVVYAVEEDCPKCSRRGLEREDGGSFVHCTACGAWWDEDHFEHLARALAVSSS